MPTEPIKVHVEVGYTIALKHLFCLPGKGKDYVMLLMTMGDEAPFEVSIADQNAVVYGNRLRTKAPKTDDGDCSVTFRPVKIDEKIVVVLRLNTYITGKELIEVTSKDGRALFEKELAGGTCTLTLAPNPNNYYEMWVDIVDASGTGTPVPPAAGSGTPPSAPPPTPSVRAGKEELAAEVSELAGEADRTLRGVNDLIQEKKDLESRLSSLKEMEAQDKAELGRLENDISRYEQLNKELKAKLADRDKDLNNVKDTYERLNEEFKKDYPAFEEQLRELASRFSVDKRIADYYIDNEKKPVDMIQSIEEAKKLLDVIEEQIRVLHRERADIGKKE